mmetsp:Transcript_22970/g.25502  ORF Transcript_22970/g.25502 Transcript_22970/m.25502 type:complete len:160 (+) Transcript_22970:33-512(+)
MPNFGGAPKCPRCNKSVYAAEEVKLGLDLRYHTSCFKCKQCGKALQKGSQKISGEDCKDKIYCSGCFNGLFGPEGFRGGGNGGMAFSRSDFAGAKAKPKNLCVCGTDVTGKKFCGDCGAKVVAMKPKAKPVVKAKSKFCGECGKPHGGAKFCPECGHKQ